MATYSDTYTMAARLNLDVNTLTAQDFDLLQQALDAASQFIDDYTGRVFGDPTATNYYQRQSLDPRDPKVLYLDDDLLSVDSLTNGDGTTIPNTEYWLEPRNAPNDVPPQPYNAIRLKVTTAWLFPTDGWVAVAGRWGFSAQPDAQIVFACLRMAEYMYRSKAPLNTTSLFDGTLQKELPEGFPTEVLTMLDSRRKLVP